MIGKTISHYKILSKLGEGGMGVVYKAEDTRLKRFVALKFLPQTLTVNASAKERFIQEAQAASALEHPNICNIHEINETDDGQLYIVMACYEGQTLKDVLTHGALPIADAIDIAEQIAKGLAKAHSKGIIHRDIKPANILITEEGTVKILDFGLAKLAGQSLHTKTGSTMGTIAYMSPEQAQGLAVDHRTDIWSFGVILYEMIAGSLPFSGEFDQAVIYHILSKEPVSLDTINPGISAEIAQFVHHTLAKKSSERYQNMHEILIDLNRLHIQESKTTQTIKHSKNGFLQSAAWQKWTALIFIIIFVILLIGGFLLWRERKPEERITLAVADFDNRTKEPELDGLSDMLITALEQSRQIEVLTRTRMLDLLRQIKNDSSGHIEEASARDICKHANIYALTIPTLRKFGKFYTIDIKVLAVREDKYLYTDKAQGEGQESILRMIDQLSERTRKCLKENPNQIQARSDNIASLSTANFEAHSHYFHGLELFQKRSYFDAKEEFKKAVDIDSSFGLAYLWLVYTDLEGDDLLKSRYMDKAVSLNERLPEKEKYFLKALQLKQEKGVDAGLVVLGQMEKLYPNDKEILYRIAYWHFYVGHFEIAEQYFNKVLALDPSHRRSLNRLTLIYEETGQYDKEYETAKRFVSLDGSDLSYYALARASASSRHTAEGIAILRTIRELNPDNSYITAYIACIYAQKDQYSKIESELDILLKENQSLQTKLAGYTTLIFNYCLYLGKYNEAFKNLNLRSEIWKKMMGSADTTLSTQNLLIKDYLITAQKISSGTMDLDNKIRRDADPASPYPDLFAVMRTFQGYYDADKIFTYKISEPTARCIRSLIKMQQNCSNIESHVDTLLFTWEPNGYPIFIDFQAAVCLYQNNKFDKALYYLNKLQKRWNVRGVRSIFYPKSLLLQAKIYEKMNDRARALQKYQQFLELWKDADPDLPDLMEAKTGLSRLKPGV